MERELDFRYKNAGIKNGIIRKELKLLNNSSLCLSSNVVFLVQNCGSKSSIHDEKKNFVVTLCILT